VRDSNFTQSSLLMLRFQDLPHHLKSVIFSEWISVNDMTAFDSAVANRSLRIEYLEILRSSTLVLREVPKISSTQDLMRLFHWLLERHLAASSLRLSNVPAPEVTFLLAHPHLCRPLEVLEFNRLDGVDTMTFRDLILACPQLQKLDLSCCGHINDSYFSSLTTQNVLAAHNITAVTNEDLSVVPVPMNQLMFPNLQQVILNNCPNLTNESIRLLCNLCPNLTQLHCRGNARLNDESLQYLAHMPHLQDIDHSLCRHITDKGIRHLAMTTHRDTLSSLSVYYCRNVSDIAMSELVQRHSMIQRLNLAGCHHFTNDGLARVAIACKEHLLSLTLTGCIKISGHGVRVLAMHCRNLTELNLAHCREIDDVCVIALWKSCERLKSLSLKECDKVTDEAFVHKSFMWIYLKHLDLDYVTKVGDPGLLTIVTYCPSLVRLRLTGCHKLTLPCLRRATTINAMLHIQIDQD